MSEGAPGRPFDCHDKLTYAGNYENLASLKDGLGYRFVKGDINDFELVDGLFAEEI